MPKAAHESHPLGWRVAVILVAGILTYANSLWGPFILDDQSTIVDNRQIRQWWSPSSVLSPEADTAIAGRPIVNLSFAINYGVGGLDVRGYHVVNIAVHLACGLLMFAIVRRTLQSLRLDQSSPPNRGNVHRDDRTSNRSSAVESGSSFFVVSGSSGTNVAFAAALLWVVHPLNSEVVDYITERTESLMALFYLLTMYASLRAHADSRGRLPALVACALGMACKESMVTAPLMVVLFDRVFVFDSFARARRARGGFYLGLTATWLVLIGLMLPGPRSAVGGFSTGVSVWTYLLNQTQTITHYVRLALWPRALVVFYGWPIPLTLADALLDGLVILALLAATAVALVRIPALGFLGAWFFITLAPTSSVIPIATEVGAERRMYLPLMAVTLLVVCCASLLWQALSRRVAISGVSTAAVTLVLILLTGSLAMATAARNREYSSSLTLARTVVDRRPTGIAHHILGEQLMLTGANGEAIAQLREAVAYGDSKAGYQLGIELFNQGQLNEAIAALEAFVGTAGLPYRLVPRWLEPSRGEVVQARAAMGQAMAMLRRWPEAAEQAQRMAAMAPGSLEARMLLADALFGQERYAEASTEYQAFLGARPEDVHALTNVGIGEIAAGKLDEAIAWFRRAVNADPRNADSHRMLAMALLDRGDASGAAAQAREGLAVSPNSVALRDLLARAVSETGRSAR